MIGYRATPRVGPVAGLKVGQGADEIGGGPMDGVSRDSTSLKYVPSTLAQWNTTLSVAGIASGAPSTLWLCQEAFGNLADSIGSVTGTAASAPSYNTAVSGWTRLAVSWALNSTSKFSGTVGVDFSTSSGLILCYQYATTPGATKAFAGIGTNQAAEILSTTFLRGISGANTADGSSTIGDGAVRPFAFQYNKTASTMTIYTLADKPSPTFTASASSSLVSIGSSMAVQSPAGGCLYAAIFTGVAAEMSQANVKSLLQTLGWTVTGY